MSDSKQPGYPVAPSGDTAYPPPQYPPQQGYPPPGVPPQGAPPSYPQAQYNAAPQVVVGVPAQTMIVRQAQPQPNDYLAFAIFVTVCCCLPFGIVGIVKGMDVRNKYTAGDMAGAEEASRSAKNWSIAGLVCGIILFVLGIILIVVYFVVILAAVNSAVSPYSY